MRIMLTGASTGIGATLYANLKQQGHEVIGVGLGGPDIVFNFQNRPELAFSNLVSQVGPTDCLINNAGITEIGFLQDHDTDLFEKVLEVNLIAPFGLTRAWFLANSQRIKNLNSGFCATVSESFGKVIFTSSTAAHIPHRGSYGYCASKAGVEMVVKVLARDWAGKEPFAAYAIAPCTIENTKMSDQVIEGVALTRGWSKEKAEDYCLKISAFGRVATHDEIWSMFDYAVNKAPIIASGAVWEIPNVL